MFIALYEFKVKAGMADDFRRSWLQTTRGIYREFGSLGSRLHQTSDPLIFVGYAQWPSKAQWAADKGALSPEYLNAREKMRACLESSRTLYEMEVSDDYLHDSAFGL